MITREEEAPYNARIASKLSHPFLTEQEEKSDNSINWTGIFVYATGTIALLSAAKLLYCWGKVQLHRKIYPEMSKRQANEEESMCFMESSTPTPQIEGVLINGEAGITAVEAV